MHFGALANPECQWAARHMSGKLLVADGLTKPLMGAAYMNFVEKLGLSSGGLTPAVRKVAVVGQGSMMLSGVVLSSLALLAIDQVVLAALILAAGVIWREGTRPKKANEPRPQKSQTRTGRNGLNPQTEKDEVAHPPNLNRLGTVSFGDSWSQQEKEVEGRSPGFIALEQAHEQEGSCMSHGVSNASAGFESFTDEIFSAGGCSRGEVRVANPRLCAFRGPASSGSSAAARGRTVMAHSEEKEKQSTPIEVLHLQVDALAEEMEVRLSVSQAGSSGRQSSHVTASEQSSHVTASRQSPHVTASEQSPHVNEDQQSMQENQAGHGSQLRQENEVGGYRGGVERGGESSGDSTTTTVPWYLNKYSKPMTGSKDWWDMSMQAQGWAIRVHATWRTRQFHPVHKLTPINTSQMMVERTTLRFDGGVHPVIL